MLYCQTLYSNNEADQEILLKRGLCLECIHLENQLHLRAIDQAWLSTFARIPQYIHTSAQMSTDT